MNDQDDASAKRALDHIFKDPDAREYLANLLFRRCRVHSLNMGGDVLAVSAHEGARNVGLAIQADLTAFNPAWLTQLLEEDNIRERRANDEPIGDDAEQRLAEYYARVEPGVSTDPDRDELE